MNLLGDAQASQWQAEGWSIPATVQEFPGLFGDFPEHVRELITAIPEPDGACMAIQDGMIPGRAFAASHSAAEAFSRHQTARRERANGVQPAARYQQRSITARPPPAR